MGSSPQTSLHSAPEEHLPLALPFLPTPSSAISEGLCHHCSIYTSHRWPPLGHTSAQVYTCWQHSPPTPQEARGEEAYTGPRTRVGVIWTRNFKVPFLPQREKEVQALGGHAPLILGTGHSWERGLRTLQHSHPRSKGSPAKAPPDPPNRIHKGLRIWWPQILQEGKRRANVCFRSSWVCKSLLPPQQRSKSDSPEQGAQRRGLDGEVPGTARTRAPHRNEGLCAEN